MKADPTSDEIRRLQGGINDLASVLSLPAMWTGHDSARVGTTLLDVLSDCCGWISPISARVTALADPIGIGFAYPHDDDSKVQARERWPPR